MYTDYDIYGLLFIVLFIHIHVLEKAMLLMILYRSHLGISTNSGSVAAQVFER